MKILMITIALMMNACGEYKRPEEKAEVSPWDQYLGNNSLIADKIFDDFLQYCIKYESQKCFDNASQLNKITIVPMDAFANKRIGGYCFKSMKYDVYEQKKVVVSRTVFIREDQLKSRHLKDAIFHELGHCLLDAKHDESEEIMNTERSSIDDKAQWENAVEELFEANADVQ